MTAQIEWAEPPQDNRSKNPGRSGRGGKHAQIAAALRERPGEWALVLVNSSASMVTAINKATLTAYAPAGEFEAVGRNHDRPAARCDVYVRFVGNGGAR